MRIALALILVGCAESRQVETWQSPQKHNMVSCLQYQPRPPIEYPDRLIAWSLAAETLCRAPFSNMGGVVRRSP